MRGGGSGVCEVGESGSGGVWDRMIREDCEQSNCVCLCVCHQICEVEWKWGERSGEVM